MIAYIRSIQDMYDGVSTSVWTQGGETNDFSITIDLHLGLTLNSYFLYFILDVLTTDIAELIPRCMFFCR